MENEYIVPAPHDGGRGVSAGLERSGLAGRWLSGRCGEFSRACDEARREAMARGGSLPLDLATSNPHEHGLEFPAERLLEIASRALREIPSARRYSPDPLGQKAARQAVADYYARRGKHGVDAGRIVLTPGTSLGYYYALRLLADAGDEVLVPQPSYPLFEDLWAMAGVGTRQYYLRHEAGAREKAWRLDPEEIAFQVTPSTRAIVVVSPHNPTGCMVSAEEWSALGAICRRHRLALLVDEVFCEFTDGAGAVMARPQAQEFPLVVTLNGFSKMFSLPGWKVAWMLIEGDEAETGWFVRALEHLSDTFLPVNELAQAMVPGVFEAGDPEVCGGLAREYARRRELALGRLRLPTPRPDGGVYLCARLPAGMDEEAAALRALREGGVIVHPGYYYDLPGHLVLTCVASPEVLAEGVDRLNSLGLERG